MSLVSIFATAMLPIVTIAAVGFALGRLREVDVEPLNTVTMYVLIPALIYHSLATTPIAGETLAKVVVGVALFVVAMTAVAELVGRALGESEPVLGAFVLTSVFPNSGNLGIPLSAFAFGAVGRSTAVLFLASQAVLIYTLGVYLASRSGGDRGLAGVKAIFRIPLIYAVVAAVSMRWLGLVPPADSTIMVTLKLVGDSSIPLLLLMLGIQLAGTNYRASFGRVGVATALKLGVAPAVGLAVVLVLGVPDSTVARVFVLECATPAAITPLILLIEFGGAIERGGVSAPEFVSATVLTSTLASVVTLTLLIALLQSGVVI